MREREPIDSFEVGFVHFLYFDEYFCFQSVCAFAAETRVFVMSCRFGSRREILVVLIDPMEIGHGSSCGSIAYCVLLL